MGLHFEILFDQVGITRSKVTVEQAKILKQQKETNWQGNILFRWMITRPWTFAILHTFTVVEIMQSVVLVL